MIAVTVWNEHRHERHDPEVAERYPEGIHGALVAGLGGLGDFRLRTATLDEPEHGLPAEVLDATDVLVWWAHVAHEEVTDDVVAAVCRRVLDGMGLVVLHSGHLSKVFTRLLGTSGQLKWRKADDTERIWVVDPAHPVARGLEECITLDAEEMYGEPFDIPAPDDLVLVSSFSGGEVFRSGCGWHRGRGKVFYFRPGDEGYPTYYVTGVLTVIANAITWAAPSGGPRPAYGEVPGR